MSNIPVGAGALNQVIAPPTKDLQQLEVFHMLLNIYFAIL